MKPIIIFTSFFDANILAKDKYMTFCYRESDSVKQNYIIFLQNFQIYSIALGMPESHKMLHIYDVQKDICKINCFCPTYDLLMSYKSDKNWNKYKLEYRKILVSKKEDIDRWVNILENDKIYILCCWENTINGCNCHRKILFDAMKATSLWKDKAIWIYRHGTGQKIKITSNQNKSVFNLTDNFSITIDDKVNFIQSFPLQDQSTISSLMESYTFSDPLAHL